ncbi:MAG: acetyl-CoA carboxylase carboxyl transferase subunit alpha, partial [Pirellulaceae bacterium]
MDYLAFEQPIADLQHELDRLDEDTSNSPAVMEKIRELRQQLTKTTREIYDNLTPWQIVQVSRHKNRPYTVDYLSLVFNEFVELHGDRKFGDDRALRVGFARLEEQKVLVCGHQKGRDFKERSENYFGCAHPEGYRKA